jgi:hypothetical protein
MRESLIEAYFVKRVGAIGGWQRKFASPGHRSVPDRVVMLNTWIAPRFIEFKATGKTLRPDQQREHERMRAAGCVVETIDSFEGVDALI